MSWAEQGVERSPPLPAGANSHSPSVSAVDAPVNVVSSSGAAPASGRSCCVCCSTSLKRTGTSTGHAPRSTRPVYPPHAAVRMSDLTPPIAASKAARCISSWTRMAYPSPCPSPAPTSTTISASKRRWMPCRACAMDGEADHVGARISCTRTSNCLACQLLTAGLHERPSRTIAFNITSKRLATATSAIFFGFPFAKSRS